MVIECLFSGSQFVDGRGTENSSGVGVVKISAGPGAGGGGQLAPADHRVVGLADRSNKGMAQPAFPNLAHALTSMTAVALADGASGKG